MNWPTHSDYQDSMQNPSVCFQEPDLKTGEAKLDMLGLPRVMSGNFASVYELRCGPQQRWAIRCFVRQVPGQQGRYARLCQYLNNITLPYLVKFDYMLKGILVKGEWFPIVKMQWVEGSPLNSWVEENLNNADALRKLAADWRAMMKDLAGHKIAHGDLQHGNIMVTPENELRLVDYDGMYAPVFGRGRAPELGHINFQHPRRTGDFYQEDLDNFSSLVIYMSLLALAADPALWQKFYTVDNLVLVAADYKNPLNSPALAKLKESSDSKVQQLAKLIEKCCLNPVENTPDFLEVMAALDKGTPLDTLPMKTPAPAAPITFSRAAEPAPGGSRPNPAYAEAAPPGKNVSRSAYENVPTVATQALKKSQPATPKNPGYNVPPPADKGPGIPSWVWAVAGALIAGVLALVLFTIFNKKPAPENTPRSESPPPATSEPYQPGPTADPTAVSQKTVAAVQNSMDLKLTPLGTLKGHAGSVDALAFSPDGKLLASGSADKTIRIWDAQSGQPKRTLSGSPEPFTTLAFLSDGKTICGISSDNVVRFWDATTGESQRKIEDQKDNLFPIAVSSEGHLLATGTSSDRKTVKVIDLLLGSTKNVFSGHGSWVKAVSFSPDGKMLVSTCHDESVNILDLGSSKMLQTLNVTGNAMDLPVFSKNDKMLATGADGRNAKIWDVQSGALRQTLSGHTGDVKACAFSPDGKLLATGGADMSVKIWDVALGAEKQTLTGHSDAITSISFSSDGTLLATASADKSIRLYDVKH